MIDAFDKRTTELCPINKVRRGVDLQALSRLHSLTRSLTHTQGVNPMVISLPDDRILVGRDTVSFFFGADGKAAKRYGLAWSESPITVSMYRRCSLVFGQQTRSLTHSCSCAALHYPYIVGILPRGVEVRTELSAHEVQSIPTLRGARFLCVRRHARRSVSIPSHLPCSTRRALGRMNEQSTQSQQGMSLVYVALPQAIHCLVPVRFQDQVEELKRTRQFEDAILLCEAVQFYANDYEKVRANESLPTRHRSLLTALCSLARSRVRACRWRRSRPSGCSWRTICSAPARTRKRWI